MATSTAVSFDSRGRPAKKLRSCYPDCKVILRWKHKNHDKEKEYEYHSAILANLSTVVDETFEINGDGSKEIVFEDVTPSTFEEAMKYLEDLGAARKMTWDRVPAVLHFYHKYDFSGGLTLCDQVMKDYFTEFLKGVDKRPEIVRDGFDGLIKLLVMADKYHLKEAVPIALTFLQMALDSEEFPFGCGMFTKDHAKILQPFFVRGSLRCPGISNRKELESEVFPKLMMLSLQNYLMSRRAPQLTLSGTDTKADGTYKYNTNTEEYESVDDRSDVFIYKQQGLQDWQIVARDDDGDETLLWWCPHSRNIPWPPRGPWVDEDGIEDEALCIKLDRVTY